MANPNLATATNIYGNSFSADLPTSLITLATNGAGSGKIFKVHTVLITNVDGVNTPFCNVQLWDGFFGVWLAYTLNVPADSAIVLIGRDNSIYLREGFSIRASASATGDVAIHTMWDEIS